MHNWRKFAMLCQKKMHLVAPELPTSAEGPLTPDCIDVDMCLQVIIVAITCSTRHWMKKVPGGRRLTWGPGFANGERPPGQRPGRTPL